MKRWIALFAFASSLQAAGPLPDNLVADGVPSIPASLRARLAPYAESRTATFQDWHPTRREILITTRFGDTMQLHSVAKPGGDRKQLTFLTEPTRGGSYSPVRGDYILFTQDNGGGEFYQFYRLDPGNPTPTLLTDGKSRNVGGRWSHSGLRYAYTSTRRNGRDNDIYLLNPADPKSDKQVLEVKGGGWEILDWSPNDGTLLLEEYISINESYFHLLDLKLGKLELLTPKSDTHYSHSHGRFDKAGKAVYLTTERRPDGTAGRKGEFQILARMDLSTRKLTYLTAQIPADVTEFEVSPDGRWVVLITNEEGLGVVRLLDTTSDKLRRGPALAPGIPAGLAWRPASTEFAFSFASATSTSDVYSYDVKSERLERWTESETGGLNPNQFAQPELVRLKSFDGLTISGFVYRPDAKRFPGRRPVLVNIHGGPESQSRPGFLGRLNYLVNEMGITLVYPNVRGSAGYGSTFLELDNGFKREDSVNDIGAFLDWLARQEYVDKDRIGVYGGSYGGYMVLASLVHYSDRLRCGIDVVGIANFLSFLKNTQDYRRDLRRVEYGDERDPAMATFLEKISPVNSVDRITRPLFVVQGFNDPRVPVTEAEQMVAARKKSGGATWYLMAKDEGHGFQKKRNVDFLFASMVLFLEENLLK